MWRTDLRLKEPGIVLPNGMLPAAMRDQEVEAFNAELYAHHWFGKTVGRQ